MYICNDLALIQVALAEQDWKRDKADARRSNNANAGQKAAQGSQQNKTRDP